MEWLEKLFSECESNEELIETIREYIEENYIADSEGMVTKEEYNAMKEELEKEVSNIKAEAEKIRVEAMLEKEIIAEGGRNVKAIMAVLEESDYIKDEDGNITGIDITGIKESAPYLFYDKKEMVEGTGVRKEIKRKESGRFMESARRAAGIER